MHAPGGTEHRAAVSEPADQRWKRFVDAASIAAGIAAYVYVAGALVVYFAFAGAGLPASAVVAEVPGRRLLVVGVILIALGTPTVAGLSLLLRVAIDRVGEVLESIEAWGHSEDAPGHLRAHFSSHGAGSSSAAAGHGFDGAVHNVGGAALTLVKGAAQWATRLAASAVGFLGVLVLAQELEPSTAAPELIALLLILAATLWALAVRALPFLSQLDPRSGQLVRYTSAFAALATVLGACYVAYQHELELPRAVILSTSGRCVTGYYLAHDAQGVHLVDGRARSLVVIPSSQVSSAAVGAAGRVQRTGIESVRCPRALRETWATLAPTNTP
jgi:hypothetical protein